jgi:FMN-dependent NADH-azoreductase
MSRILLITSSPRGAASYSSRVARTLADKLAAGDGRAVITVRDLAREPLPHIDESFAVARNTPPERLSVAQRAALERSDALVRELQAADVVIIAAAMINFGIPSTLKAWIDHVLRPGVTFRYGENGPEGLVRGKKVYLVLARGGVYAGPMQALNFQDTYLKAALGFIGLTDVEVLAVEGVALGAEAAASALGAALEKISAIAA